MTVRTERRSLGADTGSSKHEVVACVAEVVAEALGLKGVAAESVAKVCGMHDNGCIHKCLWAH